MDIKFFARNDKPVLERPKIYGVSDNGDWFIAEFIGPHYKIKQWFSGDDAETRAISSCEAFNRSIVPQGDD